MVAILNMWFVENFEVDLKLLLLKLKINSKLIPCIFVDEFDKVLLLFDPLKQCGTLWAKNSNISLWFSVLPLARSQLDLSAQEFRHRLALHYKNHSYPFLLAIHIHMYIHTYIS